MAKRQRRTEKNVPEKEPTSAVEINPVVALWYRPVKDTLTGETAFIDAHLMLADKELGLMPPNMYFFAAENSKRAEELNFIAIDQAAYALDTAKTEWDSEPTFSLMITTRFLESDEKFNSLLAKLESMEIKRSRLILTFSALTVLHLGRGVNTYLRRLREEGFTVALTDYAVDTAHFSLLFDYTFDILRIDADYLEDSYKYTRKKSAVEVLVAFAEKEGIKLIANGVTTSEIKSVMTELGLPVMCGSAVEKGTYKLDKACGIEEPEEAENEADKADEAAENAFEVVETEAPEARASASEKIKNKTAVLEEEVAKVKDEDIAKPEAEEPAEEVEEAEAEEPTEEVEEAIEEEPTEEVEETEAEEQPEEVEEPEAEEPAEEVEETEEEEPTEEVEEPAEEEQPEEVEETEAEEPAEEVEDIIEEETVAPVEEETEEPVAAVEEAIEEEPTEEAEEAEAEEPAEEVEEAVEEEPTEEVEEAIEEEQPEEDEEPAEEGAEPDNSENEAIANYLLATCMDFLTEEDIVAVVEGGLDALDEEKRRKVFEAMSEESEEPREEEYQVYDTTGAENREIADFLAAECGDFLTEEDLELVRTEGLQALDEEKRKKVFEVMSAESEEPREEDYQVYDTTGEESKNIADYLAESCGDILTEEDLELIRKEGLQALDEEKRKEVFDAMMELL